MQTNSFLKDKQILAVDNEWDVIETIQDVLSGACLDVTRNHERALEKIELTQYDLAILDIMDDHGFLLLEECVKRDIPAIILISVTAPRELLMKAVKKGAVSYLAKKHLDELGTLIHQLFSSQNQGNPAWKVMFKKLKGYNKRFKDKMEDINGDFWAASDKKWEISKGIQKRLLHNKNIIDKGI